ncbi:TonB-dependent siderophore receptor [Erythrobacter sp. HKB08]|uniref:TonB-dependent receptor plug domain-containing protein n=1 Tax=Erythrobacter sp. HKB08 TaxID=2502843 RepID=UPI001F42CF29|nr:TonB-dependent receptor [Erythrobacter sp. HKB08]
MSTAGYDPLPGTQTQEDKITITATGTRIEVEDTGQPVAIFDAEDIAEVQGADLTRVLRRAPGVTFARNGGIGSFTGVRVRGAEAEQLLTIVDGVRMSDPAAPGGGFDFGNLLAGNLEKIELLRGSNSTVWGSDAIGGVLVASTRAESRILASAEYGARDTVNLSASGGIGGDGGFLGASGSYFRTDGFSAAANGTEADGFEQWTVNGQGRLYLSYEWELFARARYAEGELEIDGFPFPSFTLADTDEFQKTRQLSGAAGAIYDGGPLFVQANYSFADTARDNFDPAFGSAPGFTSDGRSDRIEVKGEWRPIGPLLVNFGAENEWLEYETLFDAGNDTSIFGAYAQLGIEFGGLSAHAGGRFDDHARFGSAASFGADVSYEIAANLRLKASIGEGFKAPTLFQLFSDFGNETLVPEQSTSFDIGIAYKNRGWLDYAGFTLFRRDTENLIDFVSCFGVTGGICTDRPFGTYDNVGRTRAQGFELEAGKRLGDKLQLRAAYAYIDSENRTSGSPNEGNVLARRPQHALTLSADYQLQERWVFGPTLGAEMRFVSDSFDDAANSVAIDDFVVIDLRVVKPVLMLDRAKQHTLDLFARVENVTDADYQTAAGYASPGRGVFVGVRTGL